MQNESSKTEQTEAAAQTTADQSETQPKRAQAEGAPKAAVEATSQERKEPQKKQAAGPRAEASGPRQKRQTKALPASPEKRRKALPEHTSPKRTGAPRKKAPAKAKPAAKAKKPSGASTPKKPVATSETKNPKVRVIKMPTLSTFTHPSTLTKILMGALILYIVGICLFWTRYLPFTTINGTGAGFKTPHELSEIEASRADQFKLKVSGEGVGFTVGKEDLGLSFDKNRFEEEAKRHLTRFLWPVMIFMPKQETISTATLYDAEKLDQIVTENVDKRNEGIDPGANAYITYDSNTGTFTTVPASEGEALDHDKVYQRVERSVIELKDSLELNEEVLKKPTVVESDPKFAEAKKAAESYPDLSIDLRLSNMVVATVTPDMVRSWLTVGEGYEVTGNQTLVEGWTRGDLSAQLDTVGKLRTYTRHDGYSDKVIQVWDGTYGWLIDGAQLAADICQNIHNHSSVPIEIPCTQRAERYNPGGPDWGNRYLDVDITEQYCQMFDEAGNIVWSSECVTGNVEKNDGTVLGVYTIQDKKTNETLVGLDGDGDGEPDYENEVDYWMPFYYGYGLHDAVWRDNFDYDTYLTDGSHGCVNLPYYSAASLFDIINVGDVVVVHE